MVGEHYVLVATARTNGEGAHGIGEELADKLDPKVKLVGLGVGKRACDVVDGWHGGGWIGLIIGFLLGGLLLPLGGADAVVGLGKIVFDGFGA